MTNSFQFRSVGQGLFYAGSLNNGAYRFVYDCGAHRKDLRFLQAEVDRLAVECIKKSQAIDFIVISHLHYDHYSGLRQLMKSSIPIHKLYLPYMGESPELIRLLLAYDIFAREPAFVRNPEEDFELYYFVSALYSEGRYGDTQIRFTYGEPQGKENYDRIGFLKEFSNEDPEWNFVLLNRNIRKDDFIVLNSRLNAVLNGDTVENLVRRGDFGRIAEIYRNVFGKNFLNAHSTLLVHFPTAKNGIYYRGIIKRKRCLFNFYNTQNTICRKREDNLITILTGDAETDAFEENILNYYTNRFNSKTLIQVPHHGSGDTWEKLGDWKNSGDEYVIPFGWGNTYGHPSLQVIQDTDGYFVTQTDGYEYQIKIR